MSEPYTYLASGGKHTSSHGFVNYIGGATKERFQASLQEVFARHPNAVVLNGSDDWDDPQCRRPESFPQKFDIQPLAYFHSGMSGISKSGIVVSREDFDKIEREFPSKAFTHAPLDRRSGQSVRKPDSTGCILRECVSVYEEE